jgi:hypothetical protein
VSESGEWSFDSVTRHATAGVAQLVEHHVANVVVVGSNPITRFPAIECLGRFLRA